MPGEPPCFNLPLEPATVYLGFGSNLGSRAEHLAAAIRLMKGADLVIERVSPVYESPPYGYADQPDFLNLVVRAKTELDPHALFRRAKEIEKRLGRRQTIRNGPRPIDIDIIAYDDRILDDDLLTVPHPRMRDRAFVLVPLRDVAPNFVLPTTGESIEQLSAALPPASAVRLGELEQLTK